MGPAVSADQVGLAVQVLAVLAVGLALAGAVTRLLRQTLDARHARAEAVARPLLMALLTEDDRAFPVSGELPRSVERRIAALVPELTKKIRGSDRQALVEVLRDRGVLDDALRGLHSWRPIRRLHAVELLGALGVPEFRRGLEGRLTDRSRDVRLAAVRGLGRTADPAALPTLLALLDAPRRPVPDHCVTLALGRCGAGGLDHLTAALAGGPLRARRAAADVLGRLGDAAAVTALTHATRDPALDVRQAASVALGRIGSPSALTALQGVIDSDDDPTVRAAAATAIGLLATAEAVPGLTALLTEDHDLALAAAVALGRLGDPGLDALRAARDSVPEALEVLTPAGSVPPAPEPSVIR